MPRYYKHHHDHLFLGIPIYAVYILHNISVSLGRINFAREES